MTDTASIIAPAAAAVASRHRALRVLSALAHFARTQGTQPSTWRGIAMCISALGIVIRPDLMAAITAVGMAVSGLIGVLARDQAEPDRSPEVAPE